jgi:hypothetical protein
MTAPQKLVIQELADEGLASGVEQELETFHTVEPFDPASISLSSKIVALDTVLRRIRNKTIRLDPDFQRNAVWDSERKSLLIESMMLRIPLPMFYVSEDKEGIWEVVDGLQRLTTIRDFILGPGSDGKGFRLKGLEFWGDSFNEKDFYSIENRLEMSRVVNNIMEAELSFTIINPDTPENVKRNIFKRINTGGMRLSMQEIRHALYQGEATRVLKEMVLLPDYKSVLGGVVKDHRMAGRELALRFVAFSVRGWRNYKGDMDTFLSDTMRFINGEIAIEEAKPFNREKILADFSIALNRSVEMFGSHAFRRSRGRHRKTPINKALFDVWMFCFSRIPESKYVALRDGAEFLLEDYFRILDNDEGFIDSIGRYGSDPLGVKIRYTKIIDLIKGYWV